MRDPLEQMVDESVNYGVRKFRRTRMKTLKLSGVAMYVMGVACGVAWMSLVGAVEGPKVQTPMVGLIKGDLQPQGHTDGQIFKAVCLWEGRGRIDLDAVNKSENAHGPAQIRQIYLDDSNEYAGTSYTLLDCHD